jgi:hypothetical protein
MRRIVRIVPAVIGRGPKGSREEKVPAEERPEDEETAASEVEETVEETAAASEEEESFRAPEFRPAFMDEARAGGETPAPGGDAFFVTVNEGEGTSVHRFDDPVKAQGFVERLLEEGTAEGDVTAFAARRLAVQVRHRPVVTLLTNEE